MAVKSIPSSADLINSGFVKRRRLIAKFMNVFLFLCAALSVFVTFAIVYVLIRDSWDFFVNVPLFDFLFGTMWTPVFADPKFGVLPLLAATMQTAGVAMIIAVPFGLIMAIYLSEYAKPAVRETVKPALEMLEAVPTVVYGYFALLVMTPFFEQFIPGLKGINLLIPGMILGVMILPYVVSVSEDAMRAVPDSLREGGYALGMARWQVATRIVIPGAFSGITAAFILGISRAVGETMVLAVAAGQNPNLTWDLREGAATITAYIVQMSLGDVAYGSIAYQSIYAVGLLLFVITLAFNVIGFYLRRKYREVY